MNQEKSCPLHSLLSRKEGRPLRRITKEVKDHERVTELLNSTRVGYLGLYDEEGTYVVPLNFTWYNEKIYFHGSDQGRKFDALQKEGTICFTVAQDLGTITNPVPAKTGTAYLSVMVFGSVHVVTDPREATEALQSMLDKYVPGYFAKPLSQKHVEKYRSSMGSATVVCRIDPDRITAKEDSGNPGQMYYPGRKQEDDLGNRLK
ncbi:pyridoxamine 5'-phosphate oxidase family protein [Paenactinomyces guangxiensis]|uniref:pyridoxamine 5'-phosphate oxidase family protein n=1 Tax=Paenactinomyces guangxiensis TaxID=1490290 RepID=UPI001E35BFE9|nr:pyridoxamine 5'-phosphate oxidase family protein [Paenactinomyces guangxiensis]